MRKAVDIIKFARDLKTTLGTDDPYEIAAYYGINVMHSDNNIPSSTAYTLHLKNYPTVISINNRYSQKAKRLLCAHELGHALLHSDGINHFAVTEKNVYTSVEYEANLFALALVTDEDWKSSMNLSLENMNNYLLKTIIDYNLK